MVSRDIADNGQIVQPALELSSHARVESVRRGSEAEMLGDTELLLRDNCCIEFRDIAEIKELRDCPDGVSTGVLFFMMYGYRVVG